MTDTPIGMTETVEIQGHYGISPFSHDREWKFWGNARSVDDARRTIENLGLSEEPKWDRCNGWRILEVAQNAILDDGGGHERMTASVGRHVETRYEIQGLYRNIHDHGRTRGSTWRKWREADTLRSARNRCRAMSGDIAKRRNTVQGPGEMRLLVVHRDVLVVDQPDVETLTRHDIPGSPDPAHTALVFHQKGQPCAYGVTWSDEGFHAENRPQMGPLQPDAHLMRREGRLARLL